MSCHMSCYLPSRCQGDNPLCVQQRKASVQGRGVGTLTFNCFCTQTCPWDTQSPILA